MEKSTEMFRFLVEEAPDAVLVYQGRLVTYVNPCLTEWLEYASPHELFGKDPIDLIHPDDRHEFLKNLEAIEQGKILEERIVHLVRKDGKVLLVGQSAHRHVGGEGKMQIFLYFRSIGRRWKFYEEAKRSREALFSVTARELRDAVQTVLLHAHLLLKYIAVGEAEVGPASSVFSVQKSALHMAQIVGDVLDAVLLDIGRIELHREPANLPLRIASAIDRLRLEQGARLIQLTVQTEPPSMEIDPARFEQILLCLLGYAIRNSPKSSPIEVRLAAENAGAKVSIRFGGAGIAPEDLPKIFDLEFFALRTAKLDLSLFIAKGLIEAHGGWISVGSDAGHGMEFGFWLSAHGASKTLAIPPV